MTRVIAGTWGSDAHQLTALPPDLPAPWLSVLRTLAADGLRPVQAQALDQIITNIDNLIVTAPTNSGKSLVGWLALLRAVADGKRAVLLEPLRAIASEQFERLQHLAPALGPALGRNIEVCLSTGDVRHQFEFLNDPPPDHGQIVVATPERLDLLLRDPVNDPWMSSLGVVVVDEAHLLGDRNRGPTLEGLITGLRFEATAANRPCPRIVLLSATLGDTRPLEAWLAPTRVIASTDRCPSLTIAVDERGEDGTTTVTAICQQILSDPTHAVLIFVYKTTDAVSLAKKMGTALGQPAVAYHAQMPAAQREQVAQQIRSGQCRVAVTTSAMAMGVNLPSTHVIVLDSVYPGVGEVPVAQLLQMCGRAGRGQTPGQAVVLVAHHDRRGVTNLAAQLGQGPAGLTPWWSAEERRGFGSAPRQDVGRLIDRMAGVLARRTAYPTIGTPDPSKPRPPDPGASLDFLRGYFGAALGGQVLSARASAFLDYLHDHRLAHNTNEDGHWRLTVAGLSAARAGLPMRYAAAITQLLRDLLQLDEHGSVLARWTPLDWLIVLELISDQSPSLRSFSAKLETEVDAWRERHASTITSVLLADWLRGTDETSKADEICGSLDLRDDRGRPIRKQAAHQDGLMATLRAIVLWERAQGRSAADLEREWGLRNMTGVEESWRDRQLWLLAGCAEICDFPCFSWHLRHVCHADEARLTASKASLQAMRHHAYDLCGRLAVCSPLGGLLTAIRRRRQNADGATIGVQSIRTLEGAGITSVTQVMTKSVDDLVQLGLRRAFAEQVRAQVAAYYR